MALCPNCRVELGSEAQRCPLCHSLVQPGASPPAGHKPYPEHVLDPEDQERLTPRETRTIFLELFSACTLIASVVVLAINLLIDRTISWSLYPLASFGYLWLIVGIPIVLAGRLWLIFSVLGPSSLLFLFLLDALDGPAAWFLPVALPICLLLEADIMACGVLTRLSKRKGINVIAIILVGTVFICAGIDAILNWNYDGGFALSWSAIVAVAGLPAAGFLFYMHYRIVNRASLRKLFHL
jgi:hypothetical protein